ncbi:MAG: dihydrodipicolinate reductase [Marinovum sp.]|nr:dihydrodipicolinate reductase [Marinovum sp.]
MWRTWMIAFVALTAPALAQAELAKVNSKTAFVELINGKTLRRPLVRLEVLPTGSITGMGMTWEVEGSWTWQDGYFCRDLYWGGDELGYNCQEVSADGNRIRFRSDRGAGDYADFRLR